MAVFADKKFLLEFDFYNLAMIAHKMRCYNFFNLHSFVDRGHSGPGFIVDLCIFSSSSIRYDIHRSNKHGNTASREHEKKTSKPI